MSKIEKCGKELKRWNRVHFGNVKRELEKKRNLLKAAKQEAIWTGHNFCVRILKREISELIDKENRMWLQRSKVLWAAHGDQNSKLYHSRATQIKRKNSIHKIWDALGQWRSNPEDVAQCLTDYFQDLFTSTHLQQCEAAINSINTIISDDMNI